MDIAASSLSVADGWPTHPEAVIFSLESILRRGDGARPGAATDDWRHGGPGGEPPRRGPLHFSGLTALGAHPLWAGRREADRGHAGERGADGRHDAGGQPGDGTSRGEPVDGAGGAAPLRLAEGARDLLEAVSVRWPAGLVAGMDERRLEAILGELGVRACFGALAAAERPGPQLYAGLAARLGARAARCIAIEASAAGVRAAALAGLHVILVSRDGAEPEAMRAAEAVVDCLLELVPRGIEELTAMWPPPP